MATLARLQSVVKTYGHKTVLDSVDLTIPSGQVLGLVGPNGAGKTTCLRVLLGLSPADSGSVELMGQPFGPNADASVSREVKGSLAVVWADNPYPKDLTVGALTDLLSRSFGSWSDGAFQRWCHSLDLELTAKDRCGGLSRGTAMKLQLATAMAHDPELLILDEATAGLDPVARHRVLDLLAHYLAEDDRRTAIFASHITQDLEFLADRIVGIDHGRITFDLEKDTITDTMGIVRCTAAEAQRLMDEGPWESGELKVRRDSYSTTVLVPDRALLAQWDPTLPVERPTLEDFVLLQSDPSDADGVLS